MDAIKEFYHRKNMKNIKFIPEMKKYFIILWDLQKQEVKQNME